MEERNTHFLRRNFIRYPLSHYSLRFRLVSSPAMRLRTKDFLQHSICYFTVISCHVLRTSAQPVMLLTCILGLPTFKRCSDEYPNPCCFRFSLTLQTIVGIVLYITDSLFSIMQLFGVIQAELLTVSENKIK